jgi:hypothetical protein
MQADQCGIYVRSLDDKPDAADGPPLAKVMLNLLPSDTAVAYAPSPDPRHGYILFEQYGTLMALPFNAGALRTEGAAVPVAEGLAASSQLSDAISLNPRSYSASSTGVLAYLPNRAAASDGQLLWFNREGKVLGQLGPPGFYGEVALSADGKLVMVSRVTGRGYDHIWVADSARGVFTRLNPGETVDYAGDAISPDGRIAFTFMPSGSAGDIYVKSATGAGAAELLVQNGHLKHPNDWSSDGRYIIYDEHGAQKQDLWVVPMAGDRKPVPFLVTPADETLGRFSPDGSWVAYRSDESGQSEVYVQGFVPGQSPAAGIGKWQISTSGGDKPYWRHDGKEIYYIAPDGMMMAVPVLATGTSFKPGVAVPLFQTHVRGYEPYAVSPDGRFLINTLPDESEHATPITVVLNWWAGLKK